MIRQEVYDAICKIQRQLDDIAIKVDSTYKNEIAERLEAIAKEQTELAEHVRTLIR